MGNNLRHIRGQAQKELVKKFDTFFNKGYSRWEVWSDWVTLSAIAISNATDASHAEQREARYRTISKKYTKSDMELFSEILALFVVALEETRIRTFSGNCICAWSLAMTRRASFSRRMMFATAWRRLPQTSQG